MQNDVLKNKMAPWQEKGRWFHGTINYDGTWIADKSDKFVKTYLTIDLSGGRYLLAVSSYFIQTAKRNPIIDIKVKMNSMDFTSPGSTITTSGYLYPNKRIGYYLAPAINSGTIDIWVFVETTEK